MKRILMFVVLGLNLALFLYASAQLFIYVVPIVKWRASADDVLSLLLYSPLAIWLLYNVIDGIQYLLKTN
jgi:hypothetical protein